MSPNNSKPGEPILIDSVNDTWYQRLCLQVEKIHQYGLQAEITVEVRNNRNTSSVCNNNSSSQENFPSLNSDQLKDLHDASEELPKVRNINTDEALDEESFVNLGDEKIDVIELCEAVKNLPFSQMRIALINMVDINTKISLEEEISMLIASKPDNYLKVKDKVNILLDRDDFRSLILMMLCSNKENSELILKELIGKPGALSKLIKHVIPAGNDNVTFAKAISYSEIENEEAVIQLLNNIDGREKLELIKRTAEVGNLTLMKSGLNSIQKEKLQRRAVSRALLAAVDSEQEQIVNFLDKNYKSFFINAINNNEAIEEAAKKQFSKGRKAAKDIYRTLRLSYGDIGLSSIRYLYKSDPNFGDYVGLDNIRSLYKNSTQFNDYKGLDGIRSLYKGDPKFPGYEEVDGIKSLFNIKENSDKQNVTDIKNMDCVIVKPPQVQPFPTKGDGNCFFHAVFGDYVSGIYKAKNAEKMREEWHNFLSQFTSLNDPNMPEPLKKQLATVFNFFLDNPKDLTNGAKAIKELVDKTKKAIDQAEKKSKELIDSIVEKFFHDNEFQNKIFEVIKITIEKRNIRNIESPENQKSIPSIQDLLNNKEKLHNDIQEDLESCAFKLKPKLSSKKYNNKYDSEMIQNSFLNSTKLYKAYLKAIKSNNYYVYFEEIPILASLANIKITVYHDNGKKSQIFEPNQKLLGSYQSSKALWGKKEEAIISHAESHYSHATTIAAGVAGGIGENYPDSQPTQNRQSKIILSSVAAAVVGGISAYLIAVNFLTSLWWIALGITLGFTMGLGVSCHFTEPKVANIANTDKVLRPVGS